jgi:hypothetical protein
LEKISKHVLIQRITPPPGAATALIATDVCQQPPKSRLRTAIVILDANDIVLAEIAAGLNLDQLQRDLAGVFQPVQASSDTMTASISRPAPVNDIRSTSAVT